MVRILLISSLVLVCGCPLAPPETDQEACNRMFTHLMSMPCAQGEGVNFEGLVQFVCDNIEENAECDWSAYADCVIANAACDGEEPNDFWQECDDIMPADVCGSSEDLFSAGCTPGLLPLGMMLFALMATRLCKGRARP
jgi:hypothetical protein